MAIAVCALAGLSIGLWVVLIMLIAQHEKLRARVDAVERGEKTIWNFKGDPNLFAPNPMKGEQ